MGPSSLMVVYVDPLGFRLLTDDAPSVARELSLQNHDNMIGILLDIIAQTAHVAKN